LLAVVDELKIMEDAGIVKMEDDGIAEKME